MNLLEASFVRKGSETKKKHLSRCLVTSKELGEKIVADWQYRCGPEWIVGIESLDEVNPKKHKDLGTYTEIGKFTIPEKFSL